MGKKRRRSFTLRFEDEATHELLALLSSRMGVSMNRLVETMIQSEIQSASFALEEDLTHTLGRLADYRADPQAEVARFADAEVTFDDPLQARMVVKEDPQGIAARFAEAAAATRGR
ncbi:MAG: hypothetical protein QOF11_1735 [Chloroflexota bacterium]|jgi:hypothetical protein|nr:hypothetical protein [Chloroflexota bacterium]